MVRKDSNENTERRTFPRVNFRFCWRTFVSFFNRSEAIKDEFDEQFYFILKYDIDKIENYQKVKRFYFSQELQETSYCSSSSVDL